MSWVLRTLPEYLSGGATLTRRFGVPVDSGAPYITRRFDVPVENVIHLVRKFDVPIDWLAVLRRRFDVPFEFSAPPFVVRTRKFDVPFENGPNRIFRDFGVPVEFTQSVTRLFRHFNVPVEWTGGTPGVLLVQWNVLDLMVKPLPVRWNVVNAEVSGTLLVTWNNRDVLPVLNLIWRVVPDLITPFTTTPVLIPTSTVTEVDH